MANQSKAENSDGDANCVGFSAPRTESAKKYWNKFCWLCHKEKPTEKKQKCDKCYHVYHIDCLEGDSICNDCKVGKIRCRPLSSDDRKMLKRLVGKLSRDEALMNFEKQYISKPLSTIEARFEDYTTFAAFLDDIKWTAHKCMAVFDEEKKVATTAEWLQSYCVDQIKSMQACTDCYMNSCEWPDQHVTMTCKMVHPILWALDRSKSLYWPAKCMSVNDSKVTVCFFGTHKLVDLDLKDCWLYSLEPPTQENDDNQLNAEDLLAAMKEADDYIDNLRKEVGDFVYAAVDTSFDPIIHFRTSGKEDVESEELPITPVPVLNQSDLVFSTPVNDDENLSDRSSNHPLVFDAMSAIQLNMTNDQLDSSDESEDESTDSTPVGKFQAKSHNSTPVNNIQPESPSRGKGQPESTSSGKKRKSTEEIASLSSGSKARKTFSTSTNLEVFSSFMKLNFKEYVDKADRLCNGIEQLEHQVAELRTDKKRLLDENTEQKRELAHLKAENKQLNGYLKQMNAQWTTKLNEAKRKQWCVTCKKSPTHPFHCSKTCQMAYWKKQEAVRDDYNCD